VEHGRTDPRPAAHAVRRRARAARIPIRADGAARRDDRPPRRAQRLSAQTPLQPGRRGVKAFVLAGGLGTRLRPRFGDLPKPLAPIAGRPFLERQLEWLRTHGVTRAVLCTGYGGDAIREALGGGERLGVRLEYSEEAEPLGTGGALQLARGAV